MLYHLLIAVGGVFILLSGWVAVDLFARRSRANSPADCQDPHPGGHGCSHCLMADSCPHDASSADSR